MRTILLPSCFLISGICGILASHAMAQDQTPQAICAALLARGKSAELRGETETATLLYTLADRANPSDPRGADAIRNLQSQAGKLAKSTATPPHTPAPAAIQPTPPIPPASVQARLPAKPPASLPFDYTLTDTKDRKIDATILSVTATSVKFRRTSDSKEFDLPMSNLSPGDQKFLDSIGKPVPVPQSEIEITVCNSPVKITRLGNGPCGVVFFGHSGSRQMMRFICSNLADFSGLLPETFSFFLWEYPHSGPFKEVEPAISSYLSGDNPKIRPNFNGIASDVLSQIITKTGLRDFLLVGNSLGAGVLLWDYQTLHTNPNVRFLLISPTEAFMPPVNTLGKLERTMLLAADPPEIRSTQRNSDPFLQSAEAYGWVARNRDVKAMKTITESFVPQYYERRKAVRLQKQSNPKQNFRMGHKLIGTDIPAPLLSNIIKVNLGMESNEILAKRLDPYSLQNPYDVTWFHAPNETTDHLKLDKNSVCLITLPSGEAAMIRITEVVPLSNDRSAPVSATYSWRYRNAPAQLITRGIGRVTESYDLTPDPDRENTTFCTPNAAHDCTIRSGGINIEWSPPYCLYFFPTRAKLTILPADNFEKDF